MPDPNAACVVVVVLTEHLERHTRVPVPEQLPIEQLASKGECCRPPHPGSGWSQQRRLENLVFTGLLQHRDVTRDGYDYASVRVRLHKAKRHRVVAPPD